MWKVPEDVRIISLPLGFSLWKKACKVSLPQGFFLWEDEHFLYLFYGERQIAVFPATGVNPREIKKEVERYLQEQQER